MTEVSQEIKPCFQRVIDSVKDQKQRRGEFYLLQQRGLYRAIRSRKGRYAKLNPGHIKRLLIRIEMRCFGYSPILEHDKQKFKLWYKATFQEEL